MSNTEKSSPSQPQQEAVPHLHRGKTANRRLADQVREFRRILLEATRLAEREEHAVDPKDQARPGHRPLYDLQEFAEKMAWVKGLEADSKQTLLNSYEKHEKLGSIRRIAQAPAPEILEPLVRDFPNFVQVTELIGRRLHLCRMAPKNFFGCHRFY